MAKLFRGEWTVYKTSSSMSSLILEPGDIVRTGSSSTVGHAAMVYRTNYRNGTFEVSECWGGVGCQIHFGNFNGSSSNRNISQILSVARWVVKAPKLCYKIKSRATGKFLTIDGIAENGRKTMQTVTSVSKLQKWYVDIGESEILIRSKSKANIGLKKASDSGSICKIFNISNSDIDALIDMTQTNTGYKIKFSNYNLYLSADASGSNVYWASGDGSAYQLWTLEEV